MRTIAILLLLSSSAALAGPKLDVFTEGPQTVTIIRGCGLGACLPDVARFKELGRPRARKVFAVGAQEYFVRTRVVDGAFVCEKFAIVPPGSTDAEVAERAAVVMKAPCN